MMQKLKSPPRENGFRFRCLYARPLIIGCAYKYGQHDKIPRNEEWEDIQIEHTGAIDRKHGEHRNPKAEFNKRLENNMQSPFHTANIQKTNRHYTKILKSW